jgi:hypothetical protein
VGRRRGEAVGGPAAGEAGIGSRPVWFLALTLSRCSGTVSQDRRSGPGDLQGLRGPFAARGRAWGRRRVGGGGSWRRWGGAGR